MCSFESEMVFLTSPSDLNRYDDVRLPTRARSLARSSETTFGSDAVLGRLRLFGSMSEDEEDDNG